MILGGDECLSIELVNNWLIVSPETNVGKTVRWTNTNYRYFNQMTQHSTFKSILNYEMSLHLQHRVKDSTYNNSVLMKSHFFEGGRGGGHWLST